MKETVIVLDFGGQYNQLIARRVRECNVYCEILPYTVDIERIKEINPKANIVAIDYDPGATRVNQENRIKLMLAVAKENLDNELKEQQSRSNIKNVTLNTGSKHSKKEAVGV